MCLVRGRGRGSGCGSSSPSVRCPAPCCHKLMQVSALRAVASIDDAGGSDRIAGAFTACPQGTPRPAAASPAHIDNRLILL